MKEENKGVFYVLRKLYKVSEKELEPIYRLYMQETANKGCSGLWATSVTGVTFLFAFFT